LVESLDSQFKISSQKGGRCIEIFVFLLLILRGRGENRYSLLSALFAHYKRENSDKTKQGKFGI